MKEMIQNKAQMREFSRRYSVRFCLAFAAFKDLLKECPNERISLVQASWRIAIRLVSGIDSEEFQNVADNPLVLKAIACFDRRARSYFPWPFKSGEKVFPHLNYEIEIESEYV